MLLAPAFIEPCLPSPADKPPSGSNWIHEIKHDGYRLMARRDPIGIRLITRRGNDWSDRFPLVIEAVSLLKLRSCLMPAPAAVIGAVDQHERFARTGLRHRLHSAEHRCAGTQRCAADRLAASE